MSFARFRKLLVLALIAGAAYWVYRTRPTVSGFVDDVTRPLLQNKAVVEESERKRIVADAAAPAVGPDESVVLGRLRKRMTMTEVRELLGRPDEIEPFREQGVEKVRWIYRRLERELVFEDNRVVSIAVR
jgi:hypothetical protein